MVLLGEFLRARAVIREKLVMIDLINSQGEGLRLQGQVKGIDLAIDIVFGIANFEAEPEPLEINEKGFNNV